MEVVIEVYLSLWNRASVVIYFLEQILLGFLQISRIIGINVNFVLQYFVLQFPSLFVPYHIMKLDVSG